MCILSCLDRHIEKAGVAALLLSWMVLAGGSATAETAGERDFDKLLASIYNRWQEDVAYETLQEWLWECYHAPLVLNQASREELQLLCILTDDQLDQLHTHIVKNGPLISIYELQAIPGVDIATIQLLLPFVRVQEVDAIWYPGSLWNKGLLARSDYSLVRYERTLNPQKGYQYNSRQNKIPYAGSPNDILMRFSIKYPSGWELGLSTRKKAGEAFVWNTRDRRSNPQRCHWLFKNRSKTQTWLIGDYAVGYGQGVVLNAGFSIDKSSETTKISRTNNVGIKPYTSMSTAAFRGVATTWRWHPIEWTMYYSHVNLDGKIRTDATSGSQYVERVYRGNYYRTQNEIANKGNVKEQVIGGTLVYKGPYRGGELGINVLYSNYSLPIYPRVQRNHPLRFCGRHHTNGSIFYRHLWQNFHFFGEGALSRSGGKAAIAGVIVSLSHHISATVLWRHYKENFYSPYGKAFRENSSHNSNERGIYLGVGANPLRHLHLDAYYDYFHFPWCFGKPHAGHSWLAKATYRPTRTSRVYLQYKTTTKPRWAAKVQEAVVGTQQSYKLCWQHTWSKSMNTKSEIQSKCYQQLGAPTWGYAAAQSVTYKVQKLQLKGHVAWFNAKHTNSRLYFYEPNVLYAGYNFRSYQGRGMCYCCIMCCQPSATLRLELKYVLTHYRDKNTIGSGYETIYGNTKNEVMAQVIFKF